MILAESAVSKVELVNGKVYKTQPKFMTDNEIWCLRILYNFGFVPFAVQVETEKIRLEHIEQTPITDLVELGEKLTAALYWIERIGIRHGDLTEKNILVCDNHPYIIDWSESRLVCDPRPDKRPEGDKYWIEETLKRWGKPHVIQSSN